MAEIKEVATGVKTFTFQPVRLIACSTPRLAWPLAPSYDVCSVGTRVSELTRPLD